MDLLERLLEAYEAEWGQRPEPHTTDYQIATAIANTVSCWDDPLDGFASWSRALKSAGEAAT
jgi:hypothetical protein